MTDRTKIVSAIANAQGYPVTFLSRHAERIADLCLAASDVDAATAAIMRQWPRSTFVQRNAARIANAAWSGRARAEET